MSVGGGLKNYFMLRLNRSRKLLGIPAASLWRR
jgi:hypothetical protein